MGKQMCSPYIGRSAPCILVAATFPPTKQITTVIGIMSRHCPSVICYVLITQVTILSGEPVFVKVRHNSLLGSARESHFATLEGTARIIVTQAQMFVNVFHNLLIG